MSWNQLSHAEEWVLFEKNIGPYVGIDEVSLSQGELYTILINKEKKGRSGSIIAIIKGTDVRTVTSVLLKLSRRRRFQVREITLDMAPNMEQTARICFPAARRVTDRFHVQKLAYEAVQEMRVKARWEALDEESIEMAHARACGKNIMLRYLRTGIQENSCWPEVSIFSTKKNPYGPNHSACVPVFSSESILI